jgi:hypothetical protein
MFVEHPNIQANRAKNIGAIMDKVPWGDNKNRPKTNRQRNQRGKVAENLPLY